MYKLALIFLACIGAGFALANLPISTVITAGTASFFAAIGGIVIIIFAIALIFLGIKTLTDKSWHH